jgi:circadian clock protein KaiB
MEDKLTLKLFISGMSVRSIRAIENITNIGEQYRKDAYDLQIIDLSKEKEKEKASEFQIIALPTLIKSAPKPVRILLGDLSNREMILKILELE